MKLSKFLGGVAVVAAVLTLAGCSGGTSSKDSKSGNKTEADLAKAERVKTGTLEVYAPKGKNTDYLQESLKIYNKKYKTSLKIKAVDVAPNVPMVQKITPKLVAGEKMPDLIFLQDSNAGSIFNKFEKNFYSSEDYGFVKKYGSNFYSAKMNMLANVAPSKKTYGFPNDWGNAAMFYNDKAFKSAGIDMDDIKTWDEFIEAGKQLKAKTGKNLLFMRDTGELDLVNYLTEEQGLSMFDKSGNLNLLKPEVKKAYQIIKKIQDADLVSYGNSKDYTAIGQKCGAIFAGGWLASYQANDYPDDSGDWRIGKVPAISESAKSYSPMSGGSSYYVPKKSNNPTAALQFISFALTNQDCLASYMDLSGLPANTKAYDTEASHKKFAYYGDQEILQTLNEISKDSIEGYAFPYTADLGNYIEAASYDIKKNGTSVDKALQKQADEFVAKYSIKVNK
ncbi:ABC transporter substrate-binding protein [Lapidilactobacillus luobeiensis]|uniref:ABC transporter substrate-binding protein n=1 Tax=Lapidilactobacillus luobeiensis TaxID=2950371 RepID=UPI0021C33A34|nr:ABC transporter substrate-binding protein [Lapidilactobacillus luobeiensis]